MSEDAFLSDMRGGQVIVKLLVSGHNGLATATGVLLDWDADNLFVEHNGICSMIRKQAVAFVSEGAAESPHVRGRRSVAGV